MAATSIRCLSIPTTCSTRATSTSIKTSVRKPVGKSTRHFALRPISGAFTKCPSTTSIAAYRNNSQYSQDEFTEGFHGWSVALVAAAAGAALLMMRPGAAAADCGCGSPSCTCGESPAAGQVIRDEGPSMPLKDIGEAIRDKLPSLPDVGDAVKKGMPPTLPSSGNVKDVLPTSPLPSALQVGKFLERNTPNEPTR